MCSNFFEFKKKLSKNKFKKNPVGKLRILCITGIIKKKTVGYSLQLMNVSNEHLPVFSPVFLPVLKWIDKYYK